MGYSPWGRRVGHDWAHTQMWGVKVRVRSVQPATGVSGIPPNADFYSKLPTLPLFFPQTFCTDHLTHPRLDGVLTCCLPRSEDHSDCVLG